MPLKYDQVKSDDELILLFDIALNANRKAKIRWEPQDLPQFLEAHERGRIRVILSPHVLELSQVLARKEPLILYQSVSESLQNDGDEEIQKDKVH